MYDTCLFDLDGTLTDSHEGIMNGFRYALGKMNEYIPPDDVLFTFIGPPLGDSFKSLAGFTDEKTSAAVKLYREYYNEKGLFENRVYDGIPELLGKLKSAGKRLCVATSKPEPLTLRILEHFGLTVYFDSITGSLLDGSRSTKSEVIAASLKSCGITDKHGVVMIGDRMHDIIGAKSIGIDCIAVLYGFGDRAEFEKYGAEHIAASPEEVFEICSGNTID